MLLPCPSLTSFVCLFPAPGGRPMPVAIDIFRAPAPATGFTDIEDLGPLLPGKPPALPLPITTGRAELVSGGGVAAALASIKSFQKIAALLK